MSVGKGLTGESMEIPKLSSRTQEVPVHLSNLALVGQIRSLVQEQKLDCRVESLLYGDQTGHRRMYLTKQAKLDARDFAANSRGQRYFEAEQP